MHASSACENGERGTKTDLIWLTTGVSARRRASFAIGFTASNLDAPNARYVSVLSRFSLQYRIYMVRKNESRYMRQGPLKILLRRHILELFQDVADSDDYTGNGRSTEHTDDRDCSLVPSQRYVAAM